MDSLSLVPLLDGIVNPKMNIGLATGKFRATERGEVYGGRVLVIVTFTKTYATWCEELILDSMITNLIFFFIFVQFILPHHYTQVNS